MHFDKLTPSQASIEVHFSYGNVNVTFDWKIGHTGFWTNSLFLSVRKWKFTLVEGGYYYMTMTQAYLLDIGVQVSWWQEMSNCPVAGVARPALSCSHQPAASSRHQLPAP